jgi:hypothetical protein
VADQLDDGYVALDSRTAAADFIAACRNVRYWARGAVVLT